MKIINASYLEKIFDIANLKFIDSEKSHILGGVSERCLCSNLATYLRTEIKEEGINYYCDVEYNRNDGRVKTIIDNDLCITRVTCDLIVHSRGESLSNDNLIALEMKKSSRSLKEKQKDKNRLIALTKKFDKEIWSADGKTFPEHVCGYKLGIYYEINPTHKYILLETYRNGAKEVTKRINIIN